MQTKLRCFTFRFSLTLTRILFVFLNHCYSSLQLVQLGQWHYVVSDKSSERAIGWVDPGHVTSPPQANRFIIKTRHSFHCLDFMQNNLWKQDSLWSSEWFLKWKVVILKENCPQIKNFKVKYCKTVHTVLVCYLYYTKKNAEDYAWTLLLVKSVFITAWRTFLESSEDYENKFSLAFLQF